MKKNFIWLAVAALAVVIIGGRQVFRRPTVAASAWVQPTAAEVKAANRLEVFYFHRTQRCATCRSIGRYVGELVQEQFASQVASGAVVFREINVELPENRALADKFQASGPSLFFNVVKDGQEKIISETTIWRYISNEQRFKSFLQSRLSELLS